MQVDIVAEYKALQMQEQGLVKSLAADLIEPFRLPDAEQKAVIDAVVLRWKRTRKAYEAPFTLAARLTVLQVFKERARTEWRYKAMTKMLERAVFG